MASEKSPITGKYYEVDSLSVNEKVKFGFTKKDVFDEKKILKELEDTPLKVKKNHAVKSKDK